MLELCLILSNIRSCHNVGSILRSADCFGVRQVFFAGYTPYPKIPDDSRLPHLINKISRDIHKTALGAENNLKFKVFIDTLSAIAYAKNNGFFIAALEQANKSRNLQNFTMTDNTALILGNELRGLEPAILNECEVILEIPMYGKKESLNVSIAGAIAIYTLKNKVSNA